MDSTGDIRARLEAIHGEGDTDQPFIETVTEILYIGCEQLGVDRAYMTRTAREENFWKIIACTDSDDGSTPVGLVDELDRTFCHDVVESGLRIIDDVAAEHGSDSFESERFNAKSYLGVPLHHESAVYGTVCFVRSESGRNDFTSEDALLAELLAQRIEFALYRDRAEEQIEHLNEFVSMISHDLRNPLTVARGWVEAELMNGDNASLEKSIVALNRMEELISDGVEMAREARSVTETEELSLESLATSCWQSVNTGSARFEIAGELSFVGHQSRVRRLFENLLCNAVIHGGNEVTVRVGPLADGSGFFVADNGPGIPVEDRDRIFDKGFSTDGEHLGLGLAIVKAIADAHDWDVGVTESAERGARFEIRNVIVVVDD